MPYFKNLNIFIVYVDGCGVPLAICGDQRTTLGADFLLATWILPCTWILGIELGCQVCRTSTFIPGIILFLIPIYYYFNVLRL